MKILITGGLGFIGSHMAVKLIELKHEVSIVDNLSNSYIGALEGISNITGKKPETFNTDINDYDALCRIFENTEFDFVVHFAAAKSIGESVINPLKYYKNNVDGTINLVEVMRNHNVFNLVFSSSASVYGDAEIIPIPEHSKLNPTNPYGKTWL